MTTRFAVNKLRLQICDMFKNVLKSSIYWKQLKCRQNAASTAAKVNLTKRCQLESLAEAFC